MENWGILRGKLGDMTWKTGEYDMENWGILHRKLGDITWKTGGYYVENDLCNPRGSFHVDWSFKLHTGFHL